MAPREQTAAQAVDGSATSTSSPRCSTALLAAGERYTACFSAEASDFVRMNRGQGAPAGNRRPALPRHRPDPRREARDAPALARPATSPPTAPRSRAAVAGLRARAARARRRSAPADRHRRARRRAQCAADRCRRPRRSIDEVLGAARRRRSRRPLRRRARLSRLRELARPAQLARGDGVQPAVEPLPPRRQGGEVGAVRASRGTTHAFAAKMDDARGAARAHRAAGEDARARQVPRVSRAGRDGGDRVDAVLGRILGARARDASRAASRGCRHATATSCGSTRA